VEHRSALYSERCLLQGSRTRFGNQKCEFVFGIPLLIRLSAAQSQVSLSLRFPSAAFHCRADARGSLIGVTHRAIPRRICDTDNSILTYSDKKFHSPIYTPVIAPAFS
jgi:hypothetical protein